jgi:hypothetical protein
MDLDPQYEARSKEEVSAAAGCVEATQSTTSCITSATNALNETAHGHSAWKIGLSFAALLALPIAAGWFSAPVQAVPSYSRQTGMPCSTCHTSPLELTPFGRDFKLNGYTLATNERITDSGDKKEHSGLDLAKSLPLSVMVQVSVTNTGSPQPGTQNGNVEFPQQASLFLAGAWTSHIGSFAQVTYTAQGDHFSWDNTDIRYANQHKLGGKPFVYGITLNNNPTVEDLWNDTPAWGFPYVSSDSAPTPASATLIDGTLAQDVAGVGGYAMWDNHLYMAGTMYRSEHLGAPQPNSGDGAAFNIQGLAPYWRVAWQQNLSTNNYLEFGTYGIHAQSTPNVVTGPTDGYTDAALDFQYERTIPQWKNNVLTVHGTLIHENSTLNATFAAGDALFPHHQLNTARADAAYHFGNKYSATFGWFNTTGTTDPLLLAPASVSGSINGDPHSSGYIANFSWWPIQNVDVGLQYTGYTRFNGGSVNYDGSGRNAAGNNAFYGVLWFMF